MLEGLGSIADRATGGAGSSGGASVRSRVRNRLRTRRADRAFQRRTLPDGEPVADAPRHVVCVVVDALRADTVDESLTPHLAAMSGTAAVSPATWTFPAVASLLSGRYPHGHGAVRRTDDFENAVADMTGLPPQPDSDIDLLPERLAGAGYRTRGTFAMIVPFLALSGRFESHALYRDAAAERVLADHLEWLADRRGERTFSYVHLGDLHEPVDPPADYWATHDIDGTIPDIRTWRFEDVAEPSPTVERYRTHRRRLYRAAAEYVDNRLAAFLTRVEDFVEETLVVIVGDHGEGFWERAAFHADNFADPRPAYCVGHGGAPYESVARVPLCVGGSSVDRGSGLTTGLEDGPALADNSGDGGEERRSLIDVAPTVLENVGFRVSPALDGASLASSVANRRLLVESARYGYEKRAVYDGDRKLLASRGDDVAVALSLPDERPEPLPADREAELLAELPPWPDAEPTEAGGASAGDRSDEPAVSRDVQRRLDRLGYR
ncbi:sulfatase-like hydrolase/transferase [Natrinema sp. 74]|uniref:sulfatase-like hydrolase/transferase n=1 Tax=Natrinema sp. 74 TaxID=3384159 RepID=UPI0038D4638B